MQQRRNYRDKFEAQGRQRRRQRQRRRRQRRPRRLAYEVYQGPSSTQCGWGGPRWGYAGWIVSGSGVRPVRVDTVNFAQHNILEHNGLGPADRPGASTESDGGGARGPARGVAASHTPLRKPGGADYRCGAVGNEGGKEGREKQAARRHGWRAGGDLAAERLVVDRTQALDPWVVGRACAWIRRPSTRRRWGVCRGISRQVMYRLYTCRCKRSRST